jgi:hypothetical protein
LSFPPHLLDELARVFARAAVEAFLAATVAAAQEDEGVAKSDNDSSDLTPADLDPTSYDPHG